MFVDVTATAVIVGECENDCLILRNDKISKDKGSWWRIPIEVV